MGSLNTSRQKIKLLNIETLAANGVPAAGNPHATLKTPNNKFFVGSNNGPYVHVLNNIYGSLLDMTSVNTGLGGANADLSYNTVDNMIYGISTFVYSMDPNTLAVTPFYSIPGGSYNAALTNDGLNLYVGDNGYIRKYRISDQTFLTNYNFANGYVHSMKVTPDNQYVLATTISITGGGGKLIKIKISDGTVSTLDFSSTIGGTPTDDFVIIGDYIYVGDEYSYKGGKINWKNMTIDKVINLPMNCWFVSTDAQYVYFGAKSNLIFCFDPATERTATLNVPFNFSGGESLNELVYIENNIWLGTNYATNNAKIVRLYMNPFSEVGKTFAKILIKKQNQSILNPVESTEKNIYVFKSATTNLLGTIFNPAIFEDFDLIIMFAPGTTNVYTDPSIKTIIKITPAEWVDSATEESMNNYVIPIGTVFYFSCPSFPNLNIPVGGEAIIQKFYSGKMSLFFDTLPLNTQSIKLNLGYEIGGCGNDFVLTQNGVWSPNGCDYYVRWDNKNGTLPYKWRFFYSSDGRTDYASHPTAGPDSLPKKGWSNGMTISENQLITFGQSLVLNNLPFDADANCNFSIFNGTWIYLGAPSFRYRLIDNLSYHITTPLTPDGYGGNGSYQIRSSDEVYFTNSYNNSDKFPSNNWRLASYIINTCPQITTTPIFSLL